MSVQLSSDGDYVGVFNDQTGEYDWILRRTAEKYLEEKQGELNKVNFEEDKPMVSSE